MEIEILQSKTNISAIYFFAESFLRPSLYVKDIFVSKVGQVKSIRIERSAPSAG
jgi:hypothetical protein